MTTRLDLDRSLATWFHAEANGAAPDYLDEVVERVARAPQRPWWASPERWLPVDITSRANTFALPRFGRLLLVGLLILLVAGLAILAVGSQQRRLPPPFGPAANGSLAVSHDGDVYAFDAATSKERLLVGGTPYDFAASYSRDGTKLAFLRLEGGPPDKNNLDADGWPNDPRMTTIMVAAADGSGAHAVTAPLERVGAFDWSPDGTRIAHDSGDALWVVDVDSGRSTKLETNGPIQTPFWLPPSGNDIVFRTEADLAGIWAIHPDGTGLRQLTAHLPVDGNDHQNLAVSPDGAHIGFTRWVNFHAYAGSLDVATGKETFYPSPTGDSEFGFTFSPDGQHVAYTLMQEDWTTQIAVADAAGSGDERTLGPVLPPRDGGTPVDIVYAFTPDGTAIIARYGNFASATTRILPIDGSAGSVVGTGTFQSIDMQRLAR
jgi:hypothetical protein